MEFNEIWTKEKNDLMRKMRCQKKTQDEIMDFFGDDYHHQPKYLNRSEPSGIFSFDFFVNTCLFNKTNEYKKYNYTSGRQVNKLSKKACKFDNKIIIDDIEYIINYELQNINEVVSYKITLNILDEKHLDVFSYIIKEFSVFISDEILICVDNDAFYLKLMNSLFSVTHNDNENKIIYYKINI